MDFASGSREYADRGLIYMIEEHSLDASEEKAYALTRLADGRDVLG